MQAIAHEIIHSPDFALLCVQLDKGQQIFVEPSAMATMAPGIELKAGFRGGVLKSIGRALGGESLVMSTFTAQEAARELTLAPGPAGDVVHYPLQDQQLFLQRGAFLAHGPGVEVSASWQGAKGFFSGEGLVLLRASGTGDLFFNSYGAILEIEVSDSYMVDTGYVVAFEETLRYDVTVLPGLGVRSKVKSFLFGGEGLVCRFSGKGRVWIQTRCVRPFLRWVTPFRPVKSRSG